MPGLMHSVASPAESSVATTNTLVLASLPPSFFHPLILDALRGHFALYGDLYTFVPIRSFGRVIVVYYENHAAEKGKLSLDGINVGGVAGYPRVTLRVFRGEATPLDISSSSANHDSPDPRHLAPPSPTKNFLISPPGSPPIGWEPIKEDPPNATPLADDLIAALRKVQHEQDLHANGVRTMENGRGEILWRPEENPSGIGVYIEDCGQSDDPPAIILDTDKEPEWSYGVPEERPRCGIPRTVMPPVISS